MTITAYDSGRASAPYVGTFAEGAFDHILAEMHHIGTLASVAAVS